MIILGIDPGSRKAGYAVIKVEAKKFAYIESGIMRYDQIHSFIDRLGLIYNSCEQLIQRFKPDEISIESLVYVKGTTSMLKLAQARGAMLAAFMQEYQGKLFEYSPNLVKSMVTGHGHCAKEGVEKTLNLFFGRIDFRTNDESDALAIAFCHGLNCGRKDNIHGSRLGSVIKPTIRPLSNT